MKPPWWDTSWLLALCVLFRPASSFFCSKLKNGAMKRSDAFHPRFTPNQKDKAFFWFAVAVTIAGMIDAGWWYLP